MKIAKVKKHKNVEGYVVVTFEDGSKKIFPTTEKIMNESPKIKLFKNGGDLILIGHVMS